MVKTEASYCPNCNFWNSSNTASGRGVAMNKLLTRHAAKCGGELLRLEKPPSDKDWKTLIATIEYLNEQYQNCENNATARYISKVTEYLEMQKDSYLKDAVPATQPRMGDARSLADDPSNKLQV